MQGTRKLLVVLLALIAHLGYAVPPSGAQGWNASLAVGSTESLSFSARNSYADPRQEERQVVDLDDSAILATVGWQFRPHLSLTLEYLHGGDATIEQSFTTTSRSLTAPFDTFEQTVGGFQGSLPVDARFASVGLAAHVFQLGRVEVTPRLMVSRALELPGSTLRLTGVGLPSIGRVDDGGLVFSEKEPVVFTRELRVTRSDDLGWGAGLDVEIALGWKRWQDRRALSLLFSARMLRFDPIEAETDAELLELETETNGLPETIRLPAARFRMDVEPVFVGAGLRYRF